MYECVHAQSAIQYGFGFGWERHHWFLTSLVFSQHLDGSRCGSLLLHLDHQLDELEELAVLGLGGTLVRLDYPSDPVRL